MPPPHKERGNGSFLSFPFILSPPQKIINIPCNPHHHPGRGKGRAGLLSPAAAAVQKLSQPREHLAAAPASLPAPPAELLPSGEMGQRHGQLWDGRTDGRTDVLSRSLALLQPWGLLLAAALVPAGAGWGVWVAPRWHPRRRDRIWDFPGTCWHHGARCPCKGTSAKWLSPVLCCWAGSGQVLPFLSIWGGGCRLGRGHRAPLSLGGGVAPRVGALGTWWGQVPCSQSRGEAPLSSAAPRAARTAWPWRGDRASPRGGDRRAVSVAGSQPRRASLRCEQLEAGALPAAQSSPGPSPGL